MSKRLGSLADGILHGTLTMEQRCEYCDTPVWVGLDVVGVVLPQGITAQSTILWSRVKERLITMLGVDCGCYAKFHRQVAHIQDKMAKTRG